MFNPSNLFHQSDKSLPCQSVVSDIFTIISWNVHKNNIKNPLFNPYLNSLIEHYKVDFLLFQEANFKNKEKFNVSNFSFDAAANLEYGGEFYGVLTASKITSIFSNAYLTKAKEGFWGTYKSFLVTQYSLENNKKLMIINIHAINFRENNQYNIEIDRLIELIRVYEGPMILAGDLNSWSNSRIKRLHKIKDELSLNMVLFKNSEKIKSFMGNSLDYIFYRNLKLLESTVIEQKKFSDHNPLLARFSVNI